MLPILKSVVHAQETYFLSNGKYADSWEELDVDVPNEGTCGIGYGPGQAKCRLVESVTCMCLGVRGAGSHTVMIAFAKDTNIISTAPSGYEYLFEMVQVTKTNQLKKGLYCRENNYGSNRTDYHCADRVVRGDWYGSWFKME